MSPPDLTVGDMKEAFARLLGLDKAQISHYAAVIETTQGMEILYCCDDRTATAGLLECGAHALVTQVGISGNGRPPPPMPGEPQ